MKPSQKQNSNSTTNSSFNATNRAYAPDWITNAVQGFTNNVTNLAGQNPASFVAGSNGNLDRAAAGAEGLSGTPGTYDAATDLTRSVGQADAPDIASLMRSFMSPYTKQVVDATSADLDHSDNIARQQSDLSNPAAFGGSGIALTKGNLEDALSRARGTTLGGLRSQGFDTALTGATSQANLIQQQRNQRLAAAQGLDTIANDYGTNQRANIGTQIGAGTVTRGVTQDQLSAPLNLQTWATQTLPDLLRSYFGSDTSGTQTGSTISSGSGSSNPGALSTAGDIAMIASLSDRRAKCDISRVGERPDGLGLYLYRYIGKSARWFIGVMADEVAKVRPDAVRERPDGYLEVNYAALA